jgi:hypothetical protein
MYAYLRARPTENVGLAAATGAVIGFCGLLVGYAPLERMAPGVLAWWIALCAVSIVNIGFWRFSAALVARHADADPEAYRRQRLQLLLCAGYVFGCAFRSLLPRADVQRIGLFDSWASSVVIGRSVATVAELCFAAQWALLLHTVARGADCRRTVAIAWVLVPLIAVAEVCSWYGVLTTAYIGNAIEESIWALSALLVIAGCTATWPWSRPAYRAVLAALIVFCAVYVAFMCTVDIPMYASRWMMDEENGRQYLSLADGLWDASSRWTAAHSWDEWHPEIPWMSLYFSVGVWCSLALVHVPRLGHPVPPEIKSA